MVTGESMPVAKHAGGRAGRRDHQRERRAPGAGERRRRRHGAGADRQAGAGGAEQQGAGAAPGGPGRLLARPRGARRRRRSPSSSGSARPAPASPRRCCSPSPWSSITCPDALGLATPTAIMVGTGLGAQARHPLQERRGHRADRPRWTPSSSTRPGTLTEGRPVVTACSLMERPRRGAVLGRPPPSRARASTRWREAVVRAAREPRPGRCRPGRFEAVPGHGAIAAVGGGAWSWATRGCCEREGVDLSGRLDAPTRSRARVAPSSSSPSTDAPPLCSPIADARSPVGRGGGRGPPGSGHPAGDAHRRHRGDGASASPPSSASTKCWPRCCPTARPRRSMSCSGRAAGGDGRRRRQRRTGARPGRRRHRHRRRHRRRRGDRRRGAHALRPGGRRPRRRHRPGHPAQDAPEPRLGDRLQLHRPARSPPACSPRSGLTLRPEIAAISMSGSSILVAVNALLLKRLDLPADIADEPRTASVPAAARRGLARRATPPRAGRRRRRPAGGLSGCPPGPGARPGRRVRSPRLLAARSLLALLALALPACGGGEGRPSTAAPLASPALSPPAASAPPSPVASASAADAAVPASSPGSSPRRPVRSTSG